MENKFGLNLNKALVDFGVEPFKEDQKKLNFEQKVEQLYEKKGVRTSRVTKPSSSGTGTTNLPNAQPTAQPAATKPATAQPAATKPATAQPAAAKPVSAADSELLKKFQAAISSVVKKSVIEALAEAAKNVNSTTTPTSSL